MKMNEIVNVIEMLSHSQGFYLKNYLESQNFSDTIDVILFFES